MKKIYLLEHLTYSKDVITGEERLVMSRGNFPLVYTTLKAAIRSYNQLIDYYCRLYDYSIKSKDDENLMNDKRVMMVTEIISSSEQYRDVVTLYKEYTRD